MYIILAYLVKDNKIKIDTLDLLQLVLIYKCVDKLFYM